MFQKCSIKFCTNTCVGVRIQAHDFSSVLKVMYQVKGVFPCVQCLTKTCEALGSYPGSKGTSHSDIPESHKYNIKLII